MRSLAAAALGVLLATSVLAQPSPPAPPPPAEPAPPAAAPTLESWLAEADKAYAQRNMAVSATALGEAEKLAAADFEVAWRKARHHFTVAERSGSGSVKEREGKRGWEWGDKAIQAAPQKPHGHFWAAAGIGEYSNGAGILTALRQGLGPKFEAYAKATIAASPSYEHGGGHRALGRYYFVLPWPKRDLDKSIELLRKAVQHGPQKARNYAWLAEALIEDDEDEQARPVLEKCLGLNPGHEDRADGVRFKQRCKELMAEL